MKQEILDRVRQWPKSQDRRNRLREELHHVLLQESDRQGAFRDLCFVGGTALRVLYGLDRFSEDLDFSLSAEVKKPFGLLRLATRVSRSLEALGFAVRLGKVKPAKNVQSCFFVFQELLHEVDESCPRGQNLAIRYEVDTMPPRGAKETVSPVAGARLYQVRHYDLPSLFAGKLHAILCRRYAKGRDLYDFLWYVGRKVPVNGRLLENACEQTGGKRIRFDKEGLRRAVGEKFRNMNLAAARRDASPFLGDPGSLSLFDGTLLQAAARTLQLEK